MSQETGGTGKAGSRARKLQGKLDIPGVLRLTHRAQGPPGTSRLQLRFNMILKFCENCFPSSLTGAPRPNCESNNLVGLTKEKEKHPSNPQGAQAPAALGLPSRKAGFLPWALGSPPAGQEGSLLSVPLEPLLPPRPARSQQTTHL